MICGRGVTHEKDRDSLLSNQDFLWYILSGLVLVAWTNLVDARLPVAILGDWELLILIMVPSPSHWLCHCTWPGTLRVPSELSMQRSDDLLYVSLGELGLQERVEYRTVKLLLTTLTLVGPMVYFLALQRQV